MAQNKYLNLGAGRIILPGPRPAHHGLVDESIYAYPFWHNVDRNQAEGINEVVDLFKYPWPLEDNAYDGALLTHLCEHIGHEIRVHSHHQKVRLSQELFEQSIDLLTPSIGRGDPLRFHPSDIIEMQPTRAHQLEQMQDGWFAFFAELYRVLTPGAQVYILSPYAWSNGGITDPSHTRMLTPDSFTHSMQPDPNAPFAYETGGLNFAMRDVRLALTPYFQHLAGNDAMLQHALATNINVCHEFYVRLEAIK